jgi:hypothetical protein
MPVTLPPPANIINQDSPDNDIGGLAEPIEQLPAPPTKTLPLQQIQEVTPPTQSITRSGRISRPPASLVDYPMVIYEASQDITQEEPNIQWMTPIAYAASSDLDVLYMH